jgi:hypothetical protein
MKDKMMEQLSAAIEEASVLADQLNRLDFTKPEDDAVFLDCLNKLESLGLKLDGVPQMNSPKAKAYLQ